MPDVLLETANLRKEFGGFAAIGGVNTTFDSDQNHAIIGPNGAGKTTFFNLLTGSLRPTAGQIRFRETDITDHTPEEVAKEGMARSYQVSTLFNGLTVLENVRVAVQAQHTAYNFWSNADNMTEYIETAEEILDRVELDHKKDELVENLSHGEQRTLELAVALGSDPDLLLLDEPSSGMSAEETGEIIATIEGIATERTIILVEHKMSVVMAVADRIIVFHNGEVIADGPPRKIQKNEHVQEVYLGGTI